MKAISFEIKKAVWEKTRRSNYAASLQLEGFDVTPDSAERKLRTREELLRQYRRQA